MQSVDGRSASRLTGPISGVSSSSSPSPPSIQSTIPPDNRLRHKSVLTIFGHFRPAEASRRRIVSLLIASHHPYPIPLRNRIIRRMSKPHWRHGQNNQQPVWPKQPLLIARQTESGSTDRPSQLCSQTNLESTQ